ncbi:MAG: MBL fold metallo-hydrolase [Desulfobacterales bacterium]|nr:MBL fold metallo-hydrolase [Desulfobacterales bacterium]
MNPKTGMVLSALIKEENAMKIQLIRNATMKIELAGKTILTDPMLSLKHGIESFAGNEKNPTVELPLPVEDILSNVDMVLVSHVHQDHFDAAARQLLPKDMPIFCTKEYEDSIKESGFLKVTSIEDQTEWQGIKIVRTPGQHAGNEKWQKILGSVSGFLLKAENEPTLYWPGDTILYDEVEAVLKTEHPDIILPHCCGAVLEDSGPIVMNGKMAIDICGLAPKATVVAIHMEALDHATVSRQELKALADAANLTSEQFMIPQDGETLTF